MAADGSAGAVRLDSLAPTGTGSRRGGRDLFRRLAGQGGVVFGAAVVGIVILAALAAPWIAPADPNDGDMMQRLMPPSWLAGKSGGSGVFGTDQLGRDLLSRVIYGSRVSLIVGGVSVVLAGALGLLLGLLAGYTGGLVDDVIMRVTDIQLAFPFILLALAIVAVLGPGIVNMIVVFSVTGWTVYARTVRGSVLSVREKEFVEAARALGCSDARIIWRHILPNVTAPLVVIASFELAKVIIYEASLSFLGLGVPQAIPAWGQMLASGREYLQTAWWIATFPGLALMLTVLGVNFIGDGLRDALDPRLQTY